MFKLIVIILPSKSIISTLLTLEKSYVPSEFLSVVDLEEYAIIELISFTKISDLLFFGKEKLLIEILYLLHST